MKPLKEKVSITLDNDIVTEIRRLADEDDRSFSQYINKVLKEHVTNKKKRKIKLG
ncbi:MAG: toxin-antitoxin system protein [Clostridia bacterium]|nr:toxin-antitoxin system protein [Clostridia bacterium]